VEQALTPIVVDRPALPVHLGNIPWQDRTPVATVCMENTHLEELAPAVTRALIPHWAAQHATIVQLARIPLRMRPIVSTVPKESSLIVVIRFVFVAKRILTPVMPVPPFVLHARPIVTPRRDLQYVALPATM